MNLDITYADLHGVNVWSGFASLQEIRDFVAVLSLPEQEIVVEIDGDEIGLLIDLIAA